MRVSWFRLGRPAFTWRRNDRWTRRTRLPFLLVRPQRFLWEFRLLVGPERFLRFIRYVRRPQPLHLRPAPTASRTTTTRIRHLLDVSMGCVGYIRPANARVTRAMPVREAASGPLAT